MSMPTPNNPALISGRLSTNQKMTGEELQNFMNQNGIGIKEMGEILGVSKQAVNLWLTNSRSFSITNTRLVKLFMKYPQLIKEF